MKTSANGLKFLTQEEGCVLHTYLDSGGKATIGVGHLLRPGEAYPNGITLAQAQALLAVDVGTAEAAINNHCESKLTQNAFDALVSFTFNLGTGAFEGSTLLKLLNQGQYAAAADEFPKWDKVNGKPNAEIHGRRLRERALFLAPDAVQAPPVGPTVAPVAPPVPPPQVPVAPVPAINVPNPGPMGFLATLINFLSQLFRK